MLQINSSGSYSGSIDSFGQFGTDLITSSNLEKLQFGSNDTVGGVEPVVLWIGKRMNGTITEN